MGGVSPATLALSLPVAVLSGASLLLAAVRRRVAVVTVAGPSMLPALADGDRLLVRRARLAELAVGQIVVFQRPDDDHSWSSEQPIWPPARGEWLIKRVAAVPGDYVPPGIPTGAPAGRDAVVPAGQLVVLGDNHVLSYDSRSVGYIPAERLLGVVLKPGAVGTGTPRDAGHVRRHRLRWWG
jgi:signal peptidase I